MDKTLQLLSLARRAGKLALGFDAVAEALGRNRARLVLISVHAAERTRRNVLTAAGKGVQPVLVSYSPDDWSPVLGKAVGVLAVLDENFARGIRGTLPAAQPEQPPE